MQLILTTNVLKDYLGRRKLFNGIWIIHEKTINIFMNLNVKLELMNAVFIWAWKMVLVHFVLLQYQIPVLNEGIKIRRDVFTFSEIMFWIIIHDCPVHSLWCNTEVKSCWVKSCLVSSPIYTQESAKWNLRWIIFLMWLLYTGECCIE